MAEVQLALQRGPAGFEKLVVVKLVHENLAAQKDFVDMLLDEARVAALLKHPNVVDIYDLGQADGRFFIAMEYLEGEPLLAVLRAGRDGKRLDVLSTGRLVADTAEGLDAAHELRSMGGEPLELVHHDVSLGNIVVLYNGQVKLVDFGVAKATQSMSVAQPRRVQGKFSYMAPEKLRGHPGDRRSDIWSLGCVLWESLTLKRLFKGGNESDTIRQVLESEIPTPSRINGDVIAAFDPIVMRALQRDPDQRYPTAKEMATDLEEVLRKESYGGKNDKIAKYMQATFASHLEARKRLLQEVSSKGRASAAVLEAAFDDGAMTAGSPIVTADFSQRFKPNTIEIKPQPGRQTRLDTTPSRRAVNPFSPGVMMSASSAPGASGAPGAPGAPVPHIEYPRVVPSDLPPIARPDSQPGEDYAETVMMPPLDEDAMAMGTAPGAVRAASARPGSAASRRMYLAIGAAALVSVVAVILIVRGGGDEGSRPEDGSARTGSGELAVAPPAVDAALPPGDAVDEAAVAAGSGSAATAAPAQPGSHDAQNPIELPPDRVGKPKSPKPPPPPDPVALYRGGINAYVVGDMKTAMTQFKRAIAGNPGLAVAWRGLGMVHERLGDSHAAAVAFQRYLQISPNASDAGAIRAKLGGGR